MRKYLLILAGVVIGWFSVSIRADDVKPDDKDQGRSFGMFTIYQDGDIKPENWGPISAEEEKTLTDEVQTFAQKKVDEAHFKAKLVETPHFLIYSDNDPAMVDDYYAKQAEATYANLLQFFSASTTSRKPKSQRDAIWRGKAVIFISQTPGQQKVVANALRPKSNPYSIFLDGDGRVCIVLDENGQWQNAQNYMCRAITEGFLFRLRTPVVLPNWVSDGLADVMGDTISPSQNKVNPQHPLLDMNGKPSTDGHALECVKAGEYDAVLDNGKVTHYGDPLAWSLVRFMLRGSSSRFAAFVIGIKDGLDWEKSLKVKFGMDRDHLKTAYGQMLARMQ